MSLPKRNRNYLTSISNTQNILWQAVFTQTYKTTPVSDDYMIIYDSEDTPNWKRVKWSVFSSFGVTSFNTRTGAVVPATDDYTWAQIDKTTSDIADITTKSHTSLTDIGTNTHAQIDTHIADDTIHFLESSIDHTVITNIGSYSHATIDAHIDNTALHSGEVKISGTPANNQVAIWTDDETIEGAEDLTWDNSYLHFDTNRSVSHIIRGIRWGDAVAGWTTSIRETAVNQLVFAAGGDIMTLYGSGLFSHGAQQWALLKEDATATNPNIIPDYPDVDTGIGTAGANMLSLIAGGTEAMRLEATQVTMANLGSDDAEDHVVAIDDSTGVLSKRSVSSIAGTTYTFQNGLTEAAGTVELGGDITDSIDLIPDTDDSYDLHFGNSGTLRLREFRVYTADNIVIDSSAGNAPISFNAGTNNVGVASPFQMSGNYIEFLEMTPPSNPSSNYGRLYVADNGGTTTIYFKDSTGTTTDLLSTGASTFTALTDTPSNYTSAANKFLQVNGTPDAIIFDTIAWSDIQSTPTTLSGYSISDSKTNFNTALSDGSFAFDGGAHHDGFSDFVANEHVDHTTVSISTQHSLTGGGDISSTRTLNLVNDSASPGNNKLYGTNGAGARGWYDQPASGDVTVSGTPVDNQVAIWTSASEIEGDSDFTWTGTSLRVNGDIGINVSPSRALDVYETGSALMAKFESAHATHAYISIDGNTVADTMISWMENGSSQVSAGWDVGESKWYLSKGVGEISALEHMISADPDGAVTLYYDDSQRLYTTATGIIIPISGDTFDQMDIQDGNINIHRSSTVSAWTRSVSWYTDGDSNSSGWGAYGANKDTISFLWAGKSYSDFGIAVYPDAQVNLRYNNSTKLETTADGVDITGDLSASGDVITNSDIRYKKVHGEIIFEWKNFQAITPIVFSYEDNSERRFGFSAQEIESFWPDAVYYNKDKDRYGMKYNSMIAVNTTAVQKVKEEIEVLKKRLKVLENRTA